MFEAHPGSDTLMDGSRVVRDPVPPGGLHAYIKAGRDACAPLDPRLLIPGSTPAALSAAVLNFLDGDWACALTPTRLRQYVLDHYRWETHGDIKDGLWRGRSELGKILMQVRKELGERYLVAFCRRFRVDWQRDRHQMLADQQKRNL